MNNSPLEVLFPQRSTEGKVTLAVVEDRTLTGDVERVRLLVRSGRLIRSSGTPI